MGWKNHKTRTQNGIVYDYVERKAAVKHTNTLDWGGPATDPTTVAAFRSILATGRARRAARPHPVTTRYKIQVGSDYSANLKCGINDV